MSQQVAVSKSTVPGPGRRYLITIPAAARRVSPTSFAAESAFVEHLRQVKIELGPDWSEIVVAMPSMSDAEWEEKKEHLEVVQELNYGFRFVPLYEFGCSKSAFLRGLPTLVPVIKNLVRQADLIHTNFCYDLYRPTGALFVYFAKRARKPIIAVEDIDRRRDAEMNHRMGHWSTATYLMCKHVYDPIRDMLYKTYVKNVDLMLFKDQTQVDDYGKGRSNVRLFLDPNFLSEHIVSEQQVQAKIERLFVPSAPLRLFYFGRFVPYKGVIPMLRAVAEARDRGANITFAIMGSGEQHKMLLDLVEELELQDLVTFMEPRPYGGDFFEVLRAHDVLLACPLSADTPRSTWDAFASGMPVIAFDTPFYQSMALISTAVELTPWPKIGPLANKIVEIASNKTRLQPLVTAAVRTACENTGDLWLKRRIQWTEAILDSFPARRDDKDAADSFD